MVGLVLIALAVIVVLLVGLPALLARQRREQEAERLRFASAERRRVEGCGEVVLSFANHLGYIARPAISRDELRDLIDSGVGPDQLASIIACRVDDAPGLVLGYHPFGHGERNPDVKLSDEHRARHVYVVGKSGSGKTNLLRNLILQDIEAGRGVGVIAPEAEMLREEILPYIPDWRINDVIYFNPSDPDCPVSFNPLRLDEGEDLDRKVDENLTIFRRVIGAGAGPRMEEILRQALYALVSRPGSTLLDFAHLLDRNDPSFRHEIIRTSLDPQVVHFWRDVYPSLPKDAHLPVTNRLSRFVRPQSVRNSLCRPGTSGGLNFRRAMDEGKLVLCNLSDGILGEQNAQLLGQLVVSKFQLAVMNRADAPKEDRREFYLYLDEFQTYAGASATSYERMLSRARKYKLSLTLAHQNTAQLPGELLKEIMGNVSTTICFSVSREDAMRFAKEFVTLYDGEVIHVPEEEILKLRVGQAWCKIGQHAFLLHTYLADQRPDAERAREVIKRSWQNYRREFEGGGSLSPAPDDTANDVVTPVWALSRSRDDTLTNVERQQQRQHAQQRRQASSTTHSPPVRSSQPTPPDSAATTHARSNGGGRSVLDDLDPSDPFAA